MIIRKISIKTKTSSQHTKLNHELIERQTIKLIYILFQYVNVAGHSNGVPPGPIPNPEVKPIDAVVLVRSERSCEAIVPAH